MQLGLGLDAWSRLVVASLFPIRTRQGQFDDGHVCWLWTHIRREQMLLCLDLDAEAELRMNHCFDWLT